MRSCFADGSAQIPPRCCPRALAFAPCFQAPGRRQTDRGAGPGGGGGRWPGAEGEQFRVAAPPVRGPGDPRPRPRTRGRRPLARAAHADLRHPVARRSGGRRLLPGERLPDHRELSRQALFRRLRAAAGAADLSGLRGGLAPLHRHRRPVERRRSRGGLAPADPAPAVAAADAGRAGRLRGAALSAAQRRDVDDSLRVRLLPAARARRHGPCPAAARALPRPDGRASARCWPCAGSTCPSGIRATRSAPCRR
ncbi:hypothetical protein ABIE45_003768 [Methylobacterium sp. OAE515]